MSTECGNEMIHINVRDGEETKKVPVPLKTLWKFGFFREMAEPLGWEKMEEVEPAFFEDGVDCMYNVTVDDLNDVLAFSAMQDEKGGEFPGDTAEDYMDWDNIPKWCKTEYKPELLFEPGLSGEQKQQRLRAWSALTLVANYLHYPEMKHICCKRAGFLVADMDLEDVKAVYVKKAAA